jgi:type I restriction enzyme M protein
MTIFAHMQVVMCIKRHFLHMMPSSCAKNMQNGYMTLTPKRYVSIEDEEDDGIPYEEKMKKLTATLEKLLKPEIEL